MMNTSPDHAPGYDPNRYVHVAQSDLITDLATGLNMTPGALARRYDGIQPADWSIQAYLFASDQGIQKADAYGFFPNQPVLVAQGGALYLNRWKARDFEPVPGDISPFRAHLDYLYDEDEVLVEFVLDWNACLVQRPDQKQTTAQLITSVEEGIGKGVMAQMLAQLVGVSNTRYLSADALGNDFNDWITSTSLVIVEEFEDTGRRSAMSRIKNYITDEVVDVNPKHAPRYRARNLAHFVFFANAAAPIKLTELDRRFVVHRSRAQPRPPDYYRGLMAWFQREGRGYVLHYLLNRDLSLYNPRGRAPLTASHRELVEQARVPEIAYLHHAFEAQEPPFACDLVVVKHVIDHVNCVGPVRLTTRHVEDFLREIGALNLQRQYRLIPGRNGRSHVWVIRAQNHWQGDVPVERVREAYVRPDEQASQLLEHQASPAMTTAPQPQRRTVRQGFVDNHS